MQRTLSPSISTRVLLHFLTLGSSHPPHLCHNYHRVVGLIYPPPEVRNIVDKTAAFVAKNGLEFAGKIAAEKAGQAKFRFLQPDSEWGNSFTPLHLWILSLLPHHMRAVAYATTLASLSRRHFLLVMTQCARRIFAI